MEKILGEQTRIRGTVLNLLFLILTIYVGILAANTFKEGKYIGRQGAAISTITVDGSGKVYASPDLATMDFSVVSEAKTVNEAMNDNSNKMNAVIEAAKKLGIAADDLQTSGFNINPHYDYVDVAAETGSAAEVYYPSGQRVLSGYDITQTLTVKVRQDNMSKIGQIIQEATIAGANEVGDLRFTIDNPDDLRAEARKQAIDDAKAKAQVLADQLEVKLGKITGYNEGGYSPTYTMAYDRAAAGVTEKSAPAPTIQTGQNKIESNVNITYEIE